VQEANIIQNFNAIRGADPFDGLVSKGFIAGAQNIGAADNRGLQDRVVVRIPHDSWRDMTAVPLKHPPLPEKQDTVLWLLPSEVSTP
jgi:hypothetical protein